MVVTVMELAGERYRPALGTAVQIAFSIGFMLQPAIAYGLRDEFRYQLATYAPNFLLLVIMWVRSLCAWPFIVRPSSHFGNSHAERRDYIYFVILGFRTCELKKVENSDNWSRINNLPSTFHKLSRWTVFWRQTTSATTSFASTSTRHTTSHDVKILGITVSDKLSVSEHVRQAIN